MTYGLWFFQILLAVVFLGAGCAKMVLPIEALGMPFLLPPMFVRFIGACEVLGALGLILPGALRIRTELTPLAALGLSLIMLGATMFTPPDQPQFALVPIAVGVLAASVAYARWRMARPFKPSRLGVRADAG
jgi:DoxX-like family